jgi:type VII secretion protein EssB
LLSKYRYEDYIQGGRDLYKKDKLLSELAELETLEDVKTRLFTEYQYLVQKVSETKKLVPKKNVWISRITIPLLSLSLIAASFYGGRMMLLDIPFKDGLIAANTAYIRGDHLSVQSALRNYDTIVLPYDAKYILSRSYVSTEALTYTQRANILIGLAHLTDTMIFDYWIHIGRLQFHEAIDIAQRLGDDELLLFAYLKFEVFVRQDISLPGEERVRLLSYLENHIDNLNRARDEATETAG